MEIIFSRHAKRRMQLFKLEENDVMETINSYRMDRIVQSGKHEVINRTLSEKYGYPLKVVFYQESDKIFVITAYPLRKERQK